MCARRDSLDALRQQIDDLHELLVAVLDEPSNSPAQMDQTASASTITRRLHSESGTSR